MSGEASWDLTEHVCRHCNIGRILSQGSAYRCSVCGESVTGKIDKLCGCGIGGRRRVFHCRPNPARTPNNPAEFVIMFVGDEQQGARPAGAGPRRRADTATASLFNE